MAGQATDRAAKARQVMLERAAERAVDDDVVLDRSARIIRAALRRERLTLADLVPSRDGEEATAQ